MNRIKPLLLANSLHGFSLHAKDGPIGKIDDFYFSDQDWKVRHVVIEIDHWLDMRKVLVSPSNLGSTDWRKKHITADLTREQISRSPDSETVLPVALQIDRRVNAITGEGMHWPETYWSMPVGVDSATDRTDGNYDAHLRSTRILRDIEVDAEDGSPLGRIADFLIDTHCWEIPLLMIKAHDGRVFISHPDIVTSIDVGRRTAASDITQKENAEWMEYDPHYMAIMSTTE